MKVTYVAEHGGGGGGSCGGESGCGCGGGGGGGGVGVRQYERGMILSECPSGTVLGHPPGTVGHWGQAGEHGSLTGTYKGLEEASRGL